MLKINFIDFWEDFDKADNFFYNLLSQRYDIVIDEDPEVIFYSCYGQEYLRYKCTRIFYASENLRPDFKQCDYALSFDYLERENHLRLPLYHLYFEKHGYYNKLVKELSREDARRIWAGKNKFCCMLVSNPNSEERIKFFHSLNKKKQVDSGGRYLNNVGGPVLDKMEFIKDYRFVFAFENTVYPGYTTEKIVEPFAVHSIPIYNGNTQIEREFNPASFINAAAYPDYESLAARVLELDTDEEQAIEMLVQPKLAAGAAGHLEMTAAVDVFLQNIVCNLHKLPVAQNRWLLLKVKAGKLHQKIMNRIWK